MKELSTEEKAKRYDEAIKLVNSKWHYKNQPCIIDVSEIFPELKESEDERIRKTIIRFIEHDIKDGDVLCTYECDEPKIVFILKGTPKKQRALSYYCYYNIKHPYFKTDSEIGCLAPNEEDVKPATKEQRDILFQKMKEAGYEWDAYEKVLNKVTIYESKIR